MQTSGSLLIIFATAVATLLLAGNLLPIALVHAATWRNLKLAFDYRFIDTPSTDIHATTGLPQSCPGTNGYVWTGGETSGFDCFSASGALVYTEKCRLFCQTDENITGQTTAITNIKSAFSALKTEYEGSGLQVNTADNTTITFSSNAVQHCDGMVFSQTTVTADILIIVTARPMRMVITKPYAKSSFCEHLTATSGRPAVVRLNVEPTLLLSAMSPGGGAAVARTQTEITALLRRELVRTLGFTLSHFSSFRHPANVALTYKAYNSAQFPTGPITGNRIVAASGSSQAFVVTPTTPTTDKIYFHGPATAAVAAFFFNCTGITTTGVELENGERGTITGNETIANLEKRIFPSELVVADYNGTAIPVTGGGLTSLTLALLHDTGFYSYPAFAAGNYTSASAFASNFGQDMGCDFVQKTCKAAWPSQYFCQSVAGGCGVGGNTMGVCDIMSYPADDIPLAFRYFSDTKLGGADVLADYCPRYLTTENEGSCLTVTSTSATRETNNGMYFGAHSKCAMNRIVSKSLTALTVNFPGCFGVVCDLTGSKGAYLVVGKQELAACTSDMHLVEFFPPPRANVYTLSRAAAGATLIYSYNFHGMLACERLYSQCGQDLSGMPRLKKSLSVVTSVDPPWGHIDGGSTVTVLGQRLTGCTGVRFGGIGALNFKVLNDSAIQVDPGRVPNTVFGGQSSDGTGDALIELLCEIPEATPYGLCNGGCVVGRWTGMFVYATADPRIIVTPRPKMWSDFFLTVGGKALGVFISLMFTVSMTFGVKKMMARMHGKTPQEEEEEEKKKNGGEVPADQEPLMSDSTSGSGNLQPKTAAPIPTAPAASSGAVDKKADLELL